LLILTYDMKLKVSLITRRMAGNDLGRKKKFVSSLHTVRLIALAESVAIDIVQYDNGHLGPWGRWESAVS
jgi:hypothetical protein